jgi:hypothetical protein
MLALDTFRNRVLAAVDPPNSTPSERALWSLALACSVAPATPFQPEAETCALQRLAELNARNAQSFIHYLNQDARVVSIIKRWPHAHRLVAHVETLRPEKPKTESPDAKESVAEDDFARLHAAHKKLLSGLRGGSGGVD